MKILERKTVYEYKIKALICDVCKTKYTNIFEIQEFVLIETVCGYGSVFGDENRISLHMCQHCFKEKLGSYVKQESH